MITISSAQPLRALKNALDDALYRGSLYLLVNNVATSAIGFVFWTLAAHKYPASTVGVFSGITSGASLLAAVAALGLPITMTRQVANTANPAGLVLMAVAVISTAGSSLCILAVLFLAPHLPSELHIQQHGMMAPLITLMVIFTAIGTTLDAGLVATRAAKVVLLKNLAGSTVKLVTMLFLATVSQSSGLLVSFSLGLVLATTLSGVALGRQIRGNRTRFRISGLPWRYLSATMGNYLATIIGILPLTIVPIEVLAIRGAAQTASFSVAFLIAGFLNFIPATTGQVLFAEIARGGTPLGKQLRKALRAVYGLLIPAAAAMIVAAPLVLRLFGRAYSDEATGCLRMLALSALPAGGTYLISSLLIARDRLAAYTIMQIGNTILVLGCVGILLPSGLTAAASGLVVAQVLTLILCLISLAVGAAGKHHFRADTAQAGASSELNTEIAITPDDGASQYSRLRLPPQPPIHSFEGRIRELLATRPMMPTTLIAELIGWQQSAQILHDQITKLRPIYTSVEQRVSGVRYPPGETAQCGLWFPPVEIPVGLGQLRGPKQLPVVTIITGFSCWLSAVLIPSTSPEDVFAGCWQLISALGAVPHKITSHGAMAIGRHTGGRSQITAECEEFCRSLNTTLTVGRARDPETTGLIEWAHAYLEQSFLRDRVFTSPRDFNTQLHEWLTTVNAQDKQPLGCAPAALINIEKRAMLQLPDRPPVVGWRRAMRVTGRSVIHFDCNEYRVAPSMMGQAVELVADLDHVLLLRNGRMVAEYQRAWSRGGTMPEHAIQRPIAW